MDAILAAADLGTAEAAIIAILIVGIGIAMAFKGAGLGKRAVNRV